MQIIGEFLRYSNDPIFLSDNSTSFLTFFERKVEFLQLFLLGLWKELVSEDRFAFRNWD
jgi:hypothetical protein